MIWQALVTGFLTTVPFGARPAAPDPIPAVAVPANRVTITDTFWSARQKANHEGTLAANFEQCEKTGRIENFVKAAGKEGKYEGLFFNDSDVYKAIEGACLVLERTKDARLDAKLDELIAIIVAAQDPDGYLNAYYTLTSPEKKWTNLEVMHELYCAGHLIEAGIAHHRATGKRTLLDAAIRFADLIDSRYGPPPKRNGVCGHEEIELALFKLWKHTGEERYRDLATYFLAQRGRAEHVGAAPGDCDTRKLYGEYCQDHAPLEAQQHVVGHAVRAMYLYCAAADLAILTGDHTYTPALDRAWTDLTGSKMYITGGIGNSSKNEGFTAAYDLPNDSAYAETCAGIGLTMWGHRMALLHSEEGARYMDVVERGLYNGVISGVSQDGRLFNYVNPLGSNGKHHRREWFACACCPPNILRLVEQVGGMVYAQAPGTLLVNLYVASRASIPIESDDGAVIDATIEQKTEYPWEGEVTITFTLPEAAEFDLKLRVPEWCRDAEMSVNDEPVAPDRASGYASLRRRWKNGDAVKWTMAMPIERMRSHPSVKGNVGRVALQRGPIVYCFEAADNPDSPVRRSALPANADMHAEHRPDLLGGVTILRVEAQLPGDAAPALYSPSSARTVTMTAIPYYAWDNRDPGEMLVWMPESLALAGRPPDPGVTPSASHCFTSDTVAALHDTLEPTASSDQSVPRLTFWPHKGTNEWVQYDFKTPRRISHVEVYWFDDSKGGGGCALPASWRVLYDDAGEWKEAAGNDLCPVTPDAFNIVRFPVVTTDRVRLEIQLKSAASAGILEWRVLPE